MTAAPNHPAEGQSQTPSQAQSQTWWTAFSQANWLAEKRIVGYSRIVIVVNLLVIVAALALSPHFVDPTDKPVGTDFVAFWTAGQLALEGHAADAWDRDKQFAREKKALPWKSEQDAQFFPWLYPPIFMNVAALLALLPYGAALAAWIAASLPLYLASVRGIIPGRSAMVVALAFPAVFSNVVHGQNGFLTAGLLGGGLLLLKRRPWTSGILFGLLAYKPQLAAVIPLALLVGGCWRTIVSSVVTAGGTVAMSWAVWGGAAWPAFFRSLAITRASELEHGSPGWEKIQSVFSAVRMFGGSIGLAYAAQAVFAIAAGAALVWIWRRPANEAMKGAALATAAVMITPYVLDYDLIVLALPVAWLAAAGLREGFLPLEKITLLAVWLLPLLSRLMGRYLHLPPAPLVMALLLVVILRRTVKAGYSEAPELT